MDYSGLQNDYRTTTVDYRTTTVDYSDYRATTVTTHLVQLDDILVSYLPQHVSLSVQVPHHIVRVLQLRLVNHFNRNLQSTC